MCSRQREAFSGRHGGYSRMLRSRNNHKSINQSDVLSLCSQTINPYINSLQNNSHHPTLLLFLHTELRIDMNVIFNNVIYVLLSHSHLRREHVMSGTKTCSCCIHSSSTLDVEQETMNPREAKKTKLKASPVYFKADKSELQKYSAATVTRVVV